MISTKKVLFLGTLLGRGSGYLRELSIIFLFGISEQADEVIFLLTSFDSLSAVFSYGTITLLSLNYITQKRASFIELKRYFYLIGFCYASLCSFLIYSNSGFLNWGMIVPFVALLNIDYAMNLTIQQFENDYTWTAFTNLFINLILIVCVFIFPNYILFILFLIVGLFLRNYLIKRYNSRKFDYLIDSEYISKEDKKLLFLTIFGTGIFYLIPIIDRFVASNFNQMAIYNYADRLMIFPAVLVNLIFIYPSIVKLKKDDSHIINIFKQHKILLLISLLITIVPITFIHVFPLSFESNILTFIEFSSIHFLHFFSFLIILSFIQIFTIRSNFNLIILISFYMILLRIPIYFFVSDITSYTFFTLVIEIPLILTLLLIKYEK